MGIKTDRKEASVRAIGFPPVEPGAARILILGSLPSVESLRQQQYFAHPRNAFWPIMGELFGAGIDLPYSERLRRLSATGVMLWDVLRAAHRPGSLDASIDRKQMEVNDFSGLLTRHPELRLMAFNGAAAETLFRRHAMNSCGRLLDRVALVRLPSTSPAHAAMTVDQKVAVWRTALCPPSV